MAKIPKKNFSEILDFSAYIPGGIKIFYTIFYFEKDGGIKFFSKIYFIKQYS